MTKVDQVEELVEDCLELSTLFISNLAQQASLLVDLYLHSEYEESKQRIIHLAQKNDALADKELRGFVFEGMRHANPTPGVLRTTVHDVTIVDGTRGSMLIPASQTVLVATSLAAMDPIAFPEPERIDPGRPLEAYSILFGSDQYCSLRQQLAGASLAATLKEVFNLKNVRRAPGKQGIYTITEQTIGGVKLKKYLDTGSRESDIPKSLVLHYDE